jgi:hypothetical protein
MKQIFLNKTPTEQVVKLIHNDSESIVEVKISPNKEFPLYEYYHFRLLEVSSEYVYYCSDCYTYTLSDECLYDTACKQCGDTLQVGL